MVVLKLSKTKTADSKKAVEEKIIPTTIASATNTSILVSNLSFLCTVSSTQYYIIMVTPTISTICYCHIIT